MLGINNKNKQRKIIKIVIFILMVLFAIFAAIPSAVLRSYNDYNKEIILKYQSSSTWIFIILSIILYLLSVLLPNDYREAKKIANKEIYNDADLNSKVPRIAWASLVAIVFLILFLSWVFIE